MKLFMKYWDGECPIVIGLTTYDATLREICEEIGISVVSWTSIC